MPEGPEIHHAASKLHRALAGRESLEVRFGHDLLERRYASELTGRSVERVSARGKAILTEFQGGLTIYTCNQLYDSWHIVKPYAWPETRRQLRLAIHNARRSALLYSASQIEVWPIERVHDHPYLSRLGPDPLHDEIGPEAIAARYREPAFANRSFSSLLLDHKFIAGLGTSLRSEILFVALTAPDERPRDLGEERLDRLAEATYELMQRSRVTGGVTRSAPEVEALRARGLARRHWRRYVFARARHPCPRCDALIIKETRSARRLYRCPACQPLRY